MQLSDDLKKIRWFQHKNTLINNIVFLDKLEIDNSCSLALIKVNQEFVYLLFLQDAKLLIDEKEAFEKFLNKLAKNGKIQTEKGFIQWKEYLDTYNFTVNSIQSFTRGSTNTIFEVNHNSLFKLYRRLEEGEHPEDKLLVLLNDSGLTPKALSSLSWLIENKKFVFGLQIEKFENKESVWDWFLQVFTEYKEKPSQALINTLESAFEGMGVALASFHNQIFELSSFNQETQIMNASDFTLNDLEDLKKEMNNLNTEKTIEIESFLQTKSKSLKFLGIKFKQHGDFHLGQILRTASGYKIIDLEGQPVNSLAQRWKPASPLQDVASIIRSIQYAEALFFKEHNCDLEDISLKLQKSFQLAYKHIANFPLPEPWNEMLQTYVLLKALQELDYERKARPEMAWIPEQAIDKILRENN